MIPKICSGDVGVACPPTNITNPYGTFYTSFLVLGEEDNFKCSHDGGTVTFSCVKKDAATLTMNHDCLKSALTDEIDSLSNVMFALNTSKPITIEARVFNDPSHIGVISLLALKRPCFPSAVEYICRV